MELSRAALMEAIQGIRTVMEGYIDMVAIEVGLLLVDLCRVLERVTVNGQSIEDMGQEVTYLTEQVAKLTAMARTLEDMAEDAEGRFCRNNL
ncbi:hypothetical protein NDU88_006758 [Pleurodeles waltl]|uniref:Uncharacterized protein n=1 Tax=Pleurodeles waltl TaxID=8319 RepID=A0AAV7WBH5_PLEWA|nr:hypothetical protein NDU88_006758 [Pleurodeles waltl]